MNRTLRVRRLPAAGVRPGELLVATGFTDPDRGRVRCEAAPLLAAHLGGDQHEVPPGPEGVLIGVSYLGPDGSASGFGLAVHHADADAIASADHVVDRWAKAMRTRRLLIADTAALCWGARRAERMIEDADPVMTVGPPTPEQPAAAVVTDLDRVPDGTRVAFPAQGVTLAVRAESAARGLPVIDATCPLVAAAQADTAAYAERGDTVILIGDPGHASFLPLAGQAPDATVAVRTATDAAALTGLDGDRVSFVVDPGMPADDALPVIGTLRDLYPRLRGHHYDVLCYAATDRAQTIAAVAAGSELTLVLGTLDDPDCLAISAIARRCGTAVRIVHGLADLQPDDLAAAGTIGLATSRTAPPGLAAMIEHSLTGLGPLSIARRSVQTSTAHQPVHAVG